MQADKNLLSGSTTLLVLGLLEKEDLYGYQIIQELDARSDGTFQLLEGTLYPILHALEQSGCLTSRLARAETGRQRKYYHITDRGLEELARQREQWLNYSSHLQALVFGSTCLGAAL